MKRLLPYKTLAGDVGLEICEVQMDGVPLNYALVSKKEQMIALYQVERKGWDLARLAVQVNTPDEELSSGPWTDVVCAVSLAEKSTNTRTVVPLRRGGDGLWTGMVELHRDRHRSQAQVAAEVIGTVGGVPGRTIGRSEAWVIDLKARMPTKQKTIRTKWVDFNVEPQLQPYRTDPWTIEAAGDEPSVYLNSSFEGLRVLLGESPGADKGVKEAVAAQIAADAWSSLFNAALYAAEVEDGQPVWPGGWADAVLRRLLPDVFPDWSPNDALVEIVRRRVEGEGGGELATRLHYAAARQARTSKALLGFARNIHRSSNKETL